MASQTPLSGCNFAAKSKSMDLHLSPDTSKTLLWLLTMLLIDYTAVIIAVVIDLRSGLRRARRGGQPLTSGGYRRSVDKCLRYLLTLMAFTTVDAMIVVASMLFRSTRGWAIPVFPFCTTLCGLLLALIEGKSVMENTQRRSDFTETARAALSLLTDEQFTSLIDTLRSFRKE